MSKYKVGDKFIVEIKEVMDSDNGTLYRSNFSTLVFDDYGLDKLQKYDKYAENLERNHDVLKIFEEKYNKGLNDAWELARKLELSECDGGFSNDTIEKAFGCPVYDTFRLFTPKQAIAKIEDYDENKAIKVGDVVFNAREDVKAVIMDSAIAEGAWQVYTEDGYVEIWKECEFKKTGRTVDIEHLFEQIRGNE